MSKEIANFRKHFAYKKSTFISNNTKNIYICERFNLKGIKNELSY